MHLRSIDRLGAERDENTLRKDLLPTEAVALGMLIEERERKAAKGRQRLAGQTHGRGTAKACVKLAQANHNGSSEPKSTSRAASAVGMGRTTYEKAKTVVEAAKAEPDKYGDIVEEMDRTGSSAKRPGRNDIN